MLFQDNFSGRTEIGLAGDDDFSFKMGLPLAAETPDVVSAKFEQARDLGVGELVLAAPIPASSCESTLLRYAQACGLSS